MLDFFPHKDSCIIPGETDDNFGTNVNQLYFGARPRFHPSFTEICWDVFVLSCWQGNKPTNHQTPKLTNQPTTKQTNQPTSWLIDQLTNQPKEMAENITFLAEFKKDDKKLNNRQARASGFQDFSQCI